MLSPLEEVKSRIDIVELVQSYIRLHKAGINYKANCPFHGEKTPSFFVSPARQIWHCFGCGKGGDAFKFIMEIEGHDFPEALRLLAQRAGVVLKREDPRIRSERNRMYDICEEAAKIFEKSLTLTPAVQAYMKRRGVEEKTSGEFRVGFAPKSWDFLLKALVQKGFKKEEISAAGLAVKSEDKASWYDRFRSRIMFPISDGSGRVVGFSGRIFEQETRDKGQETRMEAKYVNTPSTLIYDKSKVLYGFDRAKQEIRSKNEVVVVEGQMDCVMSHQAGVKNAIAVSGTALTLYQLKIVRRLCDTMVSSFDTDAAGDSATKRSLALASELEFNRRVAVIPSGKDPADAVLENPQNWISAVAEAKPVVDFYFEKAFKENEVLTSQGKKTISSIVLPWIAELSNEIEKSHWIKIFAEKLGVDEDAVQKELVRVNNIPYSAPVVPHEPQKALSRKELLEERLLSLLAVLGEGQRKEVSNSEVVFSTPLGQKIFSSLSLGTKEFAEQGELAKHIELCRFKGEIIAQSVPNVMQEFLLCKKELGKGAVKERLLKLQQEIAEQERRGAEVTSMLKDFQKLAEELKEV